MRLACPQLFSRLHPAPLRRRAATLAVVVALHALLMFMLVRLAPPPSSPPNNRLGPLTVELLPEAPVAPRRVKVAAKARRSTHAAAAPSPPPAPVAPPTSAIWSQVVPLTGEAFAAADISRVHSPAPSTGAADGAENEGEAGGGPHGERLYDADWYRKPTNAELAAYLPAGAPHTGWGMIACKTVKDNRVEDCQEIGQSPMGSGLARAVRQAAWQFRVLPPRIGGRPLVGAWVRIRIDYSESETHRTPDALTGGG